MEAAGAERPPTPTRGEPAAPTRDGGPYTPSSGCYTSGNKELIDCFEQKHIQNSGNRSSIVAARNMWLSAWHSQEKMENKKYIYKL